MPFQEAACDDKQQCSRLFTFLACTRHYGGFKLKRTLCPAPAILFSLPTYIFTLLNLSTPDKSKISVAVSLPNMTETSIAGEV